MTDNAKYDEIMRLHNERGLTAENVVAAAKPKRSPLHDSFEWDDTIAAHQHRLGQARHLVQSFTVRIESHSDEVVRVRAFVHEPDRGAYAPVEEVIADVDRLAVVRARLRWEYEMLMRRAEAFDEFAELREATRRLLAS